MKPTARQSSAPQRPRKLAGSSLAFLPMKYLYVGFREFYLEDGLSRASALAYTSLLSLIPLAVVVLSILGLVKDKNFQEGQVVDAIFDRVLWVEEPVYIVTAVYPEKLEGPGEHSLPEAGQQLSAREMGALKGRIGEGIVEAKLLPSRRQELAQSLATFANNLRQNLGTIGLIGGLFLLVSTISLFNSIEQGLNSLWHIRAQRNPLRKFLVLWALLTLGPILLAGSFVVRAQYLDGVLSQGFIWALVPYLFTWAAFFLLYRFVPHTTVNTLGALVAAFVAGGLWEIGKVAFSHYVLTIFSSQSKETITYGSLALIPIFLFWLYFSWVLVLLGVKLCYVWQHLGVYSGKRWRAVPMTTGALEFLGTQVVAAVLEDQYKNGRGLSQFQLEKRLHIPQHQLRRVLPALINEGILREDAEDGRLIAGFPSDELSLERVTRAIRGDTSHAGVSASDPVGLAILELMDEVDGHRTQVLGGTTFASLRRQTLGNKDDPS